jgi:hypothetical protein
MAHTPAPDEPGFIPDPDHGTKSLGAATPSANPAQAAHDALDRAIVNVGKGIETYPVVNVTTLTDELRAAGVQITVGRHGRPAHYGRPAAAERAAGAAPFGVGTSVRFKPGAVVEMTEWDAAQQVPVGGEVGEVQRVYREHDDGPDLAKVVWAGGVVSERIVCDQLELASTAMPAFRRALAALTAEVEADRPRQMAEAGRQLYTDDPSFLKDAPFGDGARVRLTKAMSGFNVGTEGEVDRVYRRGTDEHGDWMVAVEWSGGGISNSVPADSLELAWPAAIERGPGDRDGRPRAATPADDAPNLYCLTVVVSGAPFEVDVHPSDYVGDVIGRAITAAGIAHTEEAITWHLRREDGSVIDAGTRLGEHLLSTSQPLFLDPDAGGGADHCARESGWCDGRVCRDHGVDCPRAERSDNSIWALEVEKALNHLILARRETVVPDELKRINEAITAAHMVLEPPASIPSVSARKARGDVKPAWWGETPAQGTRRKLIRDVLCAEDVLSETEVREFGDAIELALLEVDAFAYPQRPHMERQMFGNPEGQRTIEMLEARLAECFRLSGADPDGAGNPMLAREAVAEVRRLREEYDALEKVVTEKEERERDGRPPARAAGELRIVLEPVPGTEEMRFVELEDGEGNGVGYPMIRGEREPYSEIVIPPPSTEGDGPSPEENPNVWAAKRVARATDTLAATVGGALRELLDRGATGRRGA